MSVAERLMTAEEFWAQYADQRYELVGGRVVEKEMVNSEHSDIATFIVEFLAPYVRQHKAGRVKIEAHYKLGEHVTRIPDLSFLSSERQAQIPDKTKFIPFAPEMAIEIISPSETATSVRAKVNDYRTAGTEVMWLVYPEAEAVEVQYLQEDRIARFDKGDTLTLEAVLPGFALPLAQIFLA